jgi:bifunctional enzyme CysN/CysC
MDVLTILEQDQKKDLLRVVTAGSVDDGKSTLIGRLLYESNGIYDDQLEAVQKASGRKGSTQEGMDLSLITDGLKAEREQGITIDVAYRFFCTHKRKFIIADSPGHEQYTRNMATGASSADLAIILIDAERGVLTQTKRHTFITSLLGIRRLVVAVNKMDLVGYSQAVYEKIGEEFSAFVAKLEITDVTFLPISALVGDNVVEPSQRMPWYKGRTLLNHLETVHIASDRNLIDLRFSVQYVLRPDRTFRGYLGTLASGTMRPGDDVMVLPSRTKTRLKSVFGPDGDLGEAFPPLSVGVTVEDDVDISRGDMLVHVHNVPKCDRTLDAMIVWMNEDAMVPGKDYLIKHNTKTISGSVSTLRFRVDVNTLHRNQQDTLALNEIGRCVMTLDQPVAFDAYQCNRSTGSFIMIDRVSHNTVGAGMILDREPNAFGEGDLGHALPRSNRPPVTAIKSRNIKWHESHVTPDDRVELLKQTGCVIWLTGLSGSGKSTVAYALETELIRMGHLCYVLDGDNIRHGLNKDLAFSPDDRNENIRRIGEVAALFAHAGVIVLTAFISPYRQGREAAREAACDAPFIEVFLNVSLEQCEERDPKGLYRRARTGEITNMTGVDAPYEKPRSPEITLETGSRSVPQCVDRMVCHLQVHKILLT